GFRPFIILRDLNASKEMIHYSWSNKEKKIYASIIIMSASKKIIFEVFSAFSEDNGYFYVDNADGYFEINLPEKFKISHYPGVNIDALYHKFFDNLDYSKLIHLEQKDLMITGSRLRQFFIDSSLEQKIFYIKKDSIPVCYFHSLNPAVKKCSECGIFLCDSCYTVSEKEVYCKLCLPKKAPPPLMIQKLKLSNNEGFAGLFVRMLGFSIDLFLIIGIALLFYFGGIQLFTIKSAIPSIVKPIYIMLSQFFILVFTIGYFIFPVAKYGQTLGHKALGLFVIDENGEKPGLISAFIRFAYYILSILFIFPILGFFTILTKKTKQGFHDTLSGTFVITKNPNKKAMMSLAFIGVLLICMIGLFLNFFGIGYITGDEAKIRLEELWSSKLNPEEYSNSVVYDNKFIISNADSVLCIDSENIKQLWAINDLSSPFIPMGAKNYPLLVTGHNSDGLFIIRRIEPDTGVCLWENKIKSSYANVDFNHKMIVIYDDEKCLGYRWNGDILFTKQLKSDFGISQLILSEDILVVYLKNDENYLAEYFSSINGETIWEEVTKHSWDSYNAEDGYLYVYEYPYEDSGENIYLYYLPEKKFLWTSSKSIGDILGHFKNPLSDIKNPPEFLYTYKGVIDGNDGKTKFFIPTNTYILGVTNDYLVVIKNIGAQCILLDKFTGQIIKELDTDIQNAYIFGEDEDNIYFMRIKYNNLFFRNISNSELMVVKKSDFSIKKILIGENINYNISIYKNLVCIPSKEKIALYKLP
ncbi:MAG: RDD family protein, partial [Desulfobacterales bacterium]|nr:RDD family protein [Desulfobacterales bacterium]